VQQAVTVPTELTLASTWSGRLTPTSDGGTRLVNRIRAVYDWRHPLEAFLGVGLMEFGDFAMNRRMLRGIKARADRIIPELQDIDVGTFIPDGPPQTECGLIIEAIDPERALIMRSNSHLPKSWRADATLDWSWAFVLTPLEEGRRTRFHFRSRWTTSPWWLTLGGWLGIVPADFIMSRQMLRGVKLRAEKAAPGSLRTV